MAPFDGAAQPRPNSSLSVLIACESSGTVREAFRALGHRAFSCDLLPADDGSRYHLQGDARDALTHQRWDLLIAHPPCTYLSSSGLHWNKRVPGRAEKTQAALEFARLFFEATHIPFRCIENPIGRLGTAIRRADDVVQPYEFGHDASKATALWLYGLPKLRRDPSQRVYGRTVLTPSGRTAERFANQTDSGQNRLAPSADRWKQRSKTYSGIARAMAEQWSAHILTTAKEAA